MNSCKRVAPNAATLFQENFHPFPNVLIDLESENDISNPTFQTFSSYSQKDYKTALDYSNKIKNLAPTDPIQLYRGVCNLALGKSEEAKNILTPLTMNDWEHKDAANWYLALSALEQNNLVETKQRLEQLTNESTYIRNEAKVLLSKVVHLGSIETSK